MDNNSINQHLIFGDIDNPEVLPHWQALKKSQYAFKHDFGLDALPLEPGIIIVRGPRQYGKSTWLELQVAETITTFGPGSALYLNGDEIINAKALLESIRVLSQLFRPDAPVKRLFIDEITAVTEWEKALKRAIDAGELSNVLIVTTGSKATDLRRGTERLPGRKGKLARHHYIFTPISYAEFKRQCGGALGEMSLYAYLLSGGSPVAASAIATTGLLPDYVATITSDWILGEFAAAGRSRSHLMAVLQGIYRFGGAPLGQAKLARETGLSNNTVAQGYIDLLNDLMCVIPSYAYDADKHISLFRKPCKYHFINLLAAMVWHPQVPRSPLALANLPPQDLAVILEWAVAQELWRRACITNPEGLPDHQNYWQSKTHEIDFVVLEPGRPVDYIEVKKGAESPMSFTWFLKTHPHQILKVINPNAFETERIIGLPLEAFLLGGGPCDLR